MGWALRTLAPTGARDGLAISTVAQRISSCTVCMADCGWGLSTDANTEVLNAIHAAAPITTRQMNMLSAPHKRYNRDEFDFAFFMMSPLSSKMALDGLLADGL
jgi:hypothetical protein